MSLGIGRGHVVNKGHHLGVIPTGLTVAFLDLFQVGSPGLVMNPQATAEFLEMGQGADHRPVDGPRTPTAPKYQQGRLICRQRWAIFHSAAQRITGQNGPAAIEGPIRFAEGQKYSLGPAGQQAISEARPGILFVDHTGDALQPCRQQRRTGCVTAHSQYHIGFKPVKDPRRLPNAVCQLRQKPQFAPDPLTDQTANIHRFQRKSEFRQNSRFDTPFGTDKQHLRIGIAGQ